MDALLKLLSSYPNGTELYLEWNTGLKLSGIIDTIYETTNDDGEDFYACAFMIVTIAGEKQLISGMLYEVSSQDPPNIIKDKFGNIIWSI
ncbi:hypothetical protein LOZ80_00040 [Paenibacillus sp. HWE-109]|uniref:hypothetical protein n=1 Tax=Paenibacillus sp. HWE-109 TaxID=1306526 RepID=UPI001EDE96A2|nr:hypothetical protein [Paenibacillus sp. HWE-109]UKS27382.1 hypothetical protein LOZ80_00040 [Paenibacillus sp. HWE-109]